jgi:type IV pilus assembly protein PilY1
VVFGNGSGSYNGDAGIYVMMVNANGSNVGAPTFYYLSTGVGSRGGTPNAILYVAPADLDGDHVTDYVYAGDLLGNVWRFDLTDSNPANWAVSQVGGVPTPIYTTPGGAAQPITTAVIVASVTAVPSPRILVEFGTGQQTPFTNNSASTYQQSQQYLVGVWDWNMSTWNAQSTLQFASLTGSSAPTSSTPGSAAISGTGKLQVQTFSVFNESSAASSQTSTSATNGYYRTVSNSSICWATTTGCSGSAAQYGWYMALTSGYANINDPSFPTTATSNAAQMVYEQITFSPTLQLGAFIVNTTIPPTTNLAQCSSTLASGWTMAINPATGGAFTNSVFANSAHNFLNIGTDSVSGIALAGTGSPSIVTAGVNTYVVTQTTNGSGTIQQTNLPGSSSGKRLTWIQRR